MKGRCVWSHSRPVFVVLCSCVFVGNADHLAYGRKHVAKDNRSRFLSNQRFAATRSRSRIRCGRNDDCTGYHSTSKDLSVVGLINFKRMRERANVPSGVDIFPYIRSHYKGEEYEKALQAIEEEEYIAQQNVELQKSDIFGDPFHVDADELVKLLNARGIKVGLLTRNGRKSMEHTVSLFTGKIDLAYCRDIQPSKPHVDPFIQISKEWGIPCENLLLAGDHLDDFIASICRYCVFSSPIALHSRSCYVRSQGTKLSHTQQTVQDGLSLANCQQTPKYIEEYKKTHEFYIPDLVVESISELYQAWKDL